MKERDNPTLPIPNGLWEAAGPIEDSTPSRFVMSRGESKSARRFGFPILDFQCVGERAGNCFLCLRSQG